MPHYKIFIFFVLLFPLKCLGTDNPQGWLWYKDPKVSVETKKQKPQTPKTLKPLTAVEEMERNRKQYDEAMAKAILYPTLDNVTHARYLHDAIIRQTSLFQESWTISELLDQNTPVDMTSPGALRIARHEEGKNLKASLKDLSKSYGLIFVFKEDCPYCHQFAPVVSQFAKDYGLKVQGLSAGEGCFEGMQCSKNLSAVQNINSEGVYPLLYLANPKTKELIAVARGFVSQSALEENMKYVLKFLKQEGGI